MAGQAVSWETLGDRRKPAWARPGWRKASEGGWSNVSRDDSARVLPAEGNR